MGAAATQSQARKRGRDISKAFLALSRGGCTVRYCLCISLCLSPNSPVLNPEASFGLVLVIWFTSLCYLMHGFQA